MEHGWAEAIRYDSKLRHNARKRAELNAQRLTRLRGSRLVKRIVYPEHREAYDYVSGLYPEASIKSVVALHAPKALLDDVGYRGVGGFYDVQTRVIVISNSVAPTETDEFEDQAEYTLDEVLCHELIHYGSNYDKPLSNRDLEEEIAYGKSVGYLRGKGRSDDFIIEKNMMPYLLSTVDRWEVLSRVMRRQPGSSAVDINLWSEGHMQNMVHKLRAQLAAEMTYVATETGRRMLTLYAPTVTPTPPPVNQFVSRRNLILDDDE